MKPFAYARPTRFVDALKLLSTTARPKGGGMDLLDLAKNGVSTPELLVEVRSLEAGMDRLELRKREGGRGGGTLHVGASVTLARLASSEVVQAEFPALSDAAAEAATPQVRNVATVAGNLFQRPRCAYFRDPFFDCLKRGGTTCPSREGNHEEGAIFGNGKCCAVHPSNLAVALSAGGATAMLYGSPGPEGTPQRLVSLDESFFVPPEEDPLRECRVELGELIFQVDVAPAQDSAYAEVNWKQSFDWASASAAVVLRLEGGKVRDSRVVLGFVAPVPLRSMAAEAALKGRAPDEAAAVAAGKAAAKGATPLPGNAHKVRHLEVAVRRAVLKAAARGR